jgi:hypothetical protein
MFEKPEAQWPLLCIACLFALRPAFRGSYFDGGRFDVFNKNIDIFN